MKKSVLVTGGAGYIGSILVRLLLDKGYRVVAVDSFLHGAESLLGIWKHPDLKVLCEDIRDTKALAPHIREAWGVVHLAAIVGDPACAKQPELATQTNWDASNALFELCADSPGVRRFVFSSTCSNYGKMKDVECVSETSELNPVSLYARLKVRFEELLLRSKTREDFAPTSLRFATACGLSPRMRFDLTVNQFVREMVCKRPLDVFGGQFWRPYCHARDLAAACLLTLESPERLVRNQVFGVGDTEENYRKTTIVETIRKKVPDAEIRFVHKDEDPRDYRVDFTKIRDSLGFRITMGLDATIDELVHCLRKGVWPDPYADSHRNS